MVGMVVETLRSIFRCPQRLLWWGVPLLMRFSGIDVDEFDYSGVLGNGSLVRSVGLRHLSQDFAGATSRRSRSTAR